MILSSNPKSTLPEMKSVVRNENGAALVIGIMFIAILLMLGGAAVLTTTTDLKIGANYKASAQAFYDSEAGVNYAITKIEAGLADGSISLPTEIYADDPTNTDSFLDMTAIAYSKPSDFSFEYAGPGLKMIAQDIYSFTSIGAGSHNSSASIIVMVKRSPAIAMGLFGDELVHVHNSANAYSYSHSDEPNPDSADSTGEGDVGSNASVILKNSSFVDGNVVLGEDEPGTTDATLTEYSGASYLAEESVDWVDPDPLGIVGGEYAAKISTYSTSNLNCCGEDYTYYDAICGGRQYVFGTSADEVDVLPEDLNMDHDVTLKGKSGGANYYFTDMVLKNGTTLNIDTTNGPVNIYLTGGLEAKNNSNIINTGAPSDFSLFANSTSDSITIKNSAEFHGLIYAPYMAIELKNSASVYGAIMGKTIVMHNSFDFYFDTDLKNNGPEGKDLEICAWENVMD